LSLSTAPLISAIILLLYHSSFDRDLLEQGGADAVDDSALDLRLYDLRLDRDAGIGRAPDVVYADRSRVAVERDLGDKRAVVPARRVDRQFGPEIGVGDAERAAFARLVPVGHMRYRGAHGPGARALLQPRAPETDR